jgi:HEAT repeat protein
MLRGITVFALMFAAAPVAAQVRERPRNESPAAPQSLAATLAAGWNALATGQPDAAVRSADAILAYRPWDRTAMLLKISALAATSPDRALDVYDQTIAVKRGDDPALLEPIAAATLQQIATSNDQAIKRRALQALAESGTPGAREALEKLPDTRDNRIAADAAAAKSGDSAAAERLMVDAAAPVPQPAALADALASLGPAGEQGLLLLLGNQSPQARASAARALGTMKSESARQKLQAATQDADPIVRSTAMISLAKLGDNDALTAVDHMLASPVPDVQIAASEVWEGRPGPWVAAVQPLLDNPDGLVRLHAARAIAAVSPDDARRTLAQGLSDPNPAIRSSSAQLLTEIIATNPAVADIAALRERLRDRDPAVRLAAAGALLKLARA